MSATPHNTRSLVIGTLLALISAGCLVAFALLAGSADYPSGPPVAAVEPSNVAPPVKLTARSKRNSDRPQVRPGRANDPTAPIVLGIQITDPDPGDESRSRGGRRDHDRRRDGYSRGSKGSHKPSKHPGDKDSDGHGSPPGVAKPTTNSPDSDDDDHSPPGHAYGLHKKEVGSLSRSSSKGGPPPHAQANGHSNSSHGSSTSHGGPPPHAQANGHSKKPKK